MEEVDHLSSAPRPEPECISHLPLPTKRKKHKTQTSSDIRHHNAYQNDRNATMLSSRLILSFLTFVLHRASSFSMTANYNDRRSSRRWNGNYKTAKKLSELPKSKILRIDLVANGVTKRLEKKREESLQHVLTKAVLWKLFMDEYPNIEIEHDIGDPNYLPDVVNINESEENQSQQPLFWGESGRMKAHKAVDLMQRYPDMNIVHCRWGMDIEDISRPLLEYLQDKFDSGELDLSQRKGKFTFCSVPHDVWRFIDEETGVIQVKKRDLQWKELVFPNDIVLEE